MYNGRHKRGVATEDENEPTIHNARNVFATAVLADLHWQLTSFYSDIGWVSIDPELMEECPSDVGQFQSSREIISGSPFLCLWGLLFNAPNAPPPAWPSHGGP
jgi:hypothetical protein